MTDAQTAEPKAGESHQFQAEVAELLRLMVHSVYSETDVFLRELISNASDACDRLRYEAIASPDLLVEDAELKIRLTPDKDAGTLTIADNGIGMDRQELIDNLGTVARSGSSVPGERNGSGSGKTRRSSRIAARCGLQPSRRSPPRRARARSGVR